MENKLGNSVSQPVAGPDQPSIAPLNCPPAAPEQPGEQGG